MTALGEWLKQLILLVMLAVFTDLLLPTHAMQKYVRTVLGLAIIAAMLQPVLPFFDMNWADQLAATVGKELTAEQAQSTNQAMPDLSVLRGEMQSQTEATANQLIASQIANGLSASFALGRLRVQVSGAVHGPRYTTVVVTTDALSRELQGRIARYVANQLQISPAQVSFNLG